jgi:thioredoxin reductase (NADPH)
MKLRGEQVAVILADYRMPGLTGIEFLEAAMDMYPYARRVLLTAYADTERGDRRDQRRRPRPLPAQAVGPAGREALPGDRRPAQGLAAGGPQAGPGGQAGRPPLVGASCRARDFLARNQVPYRWYSSDTDEGRRLLGAGRADGRTLPVLITAEGEPLIGPSHAEVAAKVGLSTTPTATSTTWS